MDAIIQSQVFFFISSLGFITLWVLAVVFLVYLIRATESFSKIMEKASKDIDEIGDTTKEMVEDMRDSAVFGFLFRKKRKSRKD